MLARYKGLNEVLNAYENKAKAPYFSLWCKNMAIAQYTGDDIDEAKEIITHEIEQNVKSNFNEVCTLKLHTDKEKKYTTKSDCYANICFLSTDKTTPDYSNNNNMMFFYQNELNTLKSEIEALKMIKKQEESEELEDDEEEEDENVGMIGQVNQLLTHPIISGLIDKWVNGSQPVKNLAGVTNDVEDCINVLFSKGVTLKHLQKLADMPESKIKMLLTML